MNDTDHFVEVSYSKDGGHNWSNKKRRSIGKVGQYEQRVKLVRMGRGRQWMFKITVSSPRKRDLLGGVLTVEPMDD
ncbi:hypothetical protein [Stenotrophomonas sp.]|uniref:hypothetical protein n=1 Tax=Stenotrophomonas sp. TaxID=69392 RepID=UPI0028A0943C|nr:hypothetical protein [Stenotrophomonas sp.]